MSAMKKTHTVPCPNSGVSDDGKEFFGIYKNPREGNAITKKWSYLFLLPSLKEYCNWLILKYIKPKDICFYRFRFLFTIFIKSNHYGNFSHPFCNQIGIALFHCFHFTRSVLHILLSPHKNATNNLINWTHCILGLITHFEDDVIQVAKFRSGINIP